MRDGQTKIELVDEEFTGYSSRTDGFEEFDTIDKLFNYMKRELDKKQLVNAKYDREFGYPKSVGITSGYGNHSSRSIVISKFEKIETDEK